MTVNRVPDHGQALHALGHGIRRLNLQMKRVFLAVAQEGALTPGQIRLLFHLAQDGTGKVSDLSDRLGITPGAVTGMVDKLEEQGLVERVRSRNDRRVVHVRLTDAGQRHVEQVRARFTHILSEAFKEVPTARVAEMSAVIHAVADALERHFEQKAN
ncbi:hypothetical protein JCM14720_17880 [Calditerricola yamamurae]